MLPPVSTTLPTMLLSTCYFDTLLIQLLPVVFVYWPFAENMLAALAFDDHDIAVVCALAFESPHHTL